MLPPFRVRKLVPADAGESSHRPTIDPSRRRSSSSLSDGVIRMSKEAYDELLNREPQAALSYLDEDDGDIILVGSSLELGHRLQDPVPAQPRLRNQAYLKVDLANTSSLHGFEIKRQEDVLKEWRELEKLTRDAKKERENKPAAGLPEADIPATQNDTSTRTPPKKKYDVSFGEQSPLARNAPKLPPSSRNAEQHTKRWASYSSLPAHFEAGTMNVAELVNKEEKEIPAAKPNKMSVAAVCNKEREEPTPTSSAPTIHSFKPSSGTPIFASTAADRRAALGAAEQRREYLQRLKASSEFTVPEFVLSLGDQRSPEEMRFELWKNANLRATTNPGHTSAEAMNTHVAARDDNADKIADVLPSMSTTGYQPLLSHFNEQLSKLSGSAISTALSTDPALSIPGSTTSAPDPPEQIPEPVTKKGTIVLTDERLADSIKSIMAGVSQLTAAFSQSKVELNNTLNLARQDFPHGLKDAFRAGATAVDAFRGVVPQNAGTGYQPSSATNTLTTSGAPKAARLLTSEPAVDNATKIADTVEITATTPRKIVFSDLTKWTPEFIDARRSISYTTRNGSFEPFHEYLVQWIDRPREDGIWISTNHMRQIEPLKLLMVEFDAVLSKQTLPGHAFDTRMNSGKAADWHNSTISLSAAPLDTLLPAKAKDTSTEAPKVAQSFLKKVQEASQARRIAKITDAMEAKSAERAWTNSEDKLLHELLAGKTHMQLHDWRTWGNVAGKFLNRSTDSLKTRWETIKVLEQPSTNNTAKVEEKFQQKKDVPIWAQRAKTAAKTGDKEAASSASPASTSEVLAESQSKMLSDENFLKLDNKIDGLSTSTQGLPPIQFGANQGGALADYQMQLMLLEQQNKRRLMMARQEQDISGVASTTAPAADKSINTDAKKPAQSSSTTVLPPLLPASAYDTTKYANTMLAPATSIPAYHSTFPTYSSTYPAPCIQPSSYGTSLPYVMPPVYGAHQPTYGGNSIMPYSHHAPPYWSEDYMKSQLDHTNVHRMRLEEQRKQQEEQRNRQLQQSKRQQEQSKRQANYMQIQQGPGKPSRSSETVENRPDRDLPGFAKCSAMPTTTYDWKATQHDWTTPFDYSTLPPPPSIPAPADYRFDFHPQGYTTDSHQMSSLIKGGEAPMPFVQPGSYLKTANVAATKKATTTQAMSTLSAERVLPSPLTGLGSKAAPTTSLVSDDKPNGPAACADSWSSSEWMPQWPTLQYNSAPAAPKMSAASIPVSKTAATKDARSTPKYSLAKSQSQREAEAASEASNNMSPAPKSSSSKPSTSFGPLGAGTKPAPAPEFIDFDTYLHDQIGMDNDYPQPMKPTQPKAPKSAWVARCIKNLTEMGYSPAEKVEEISEACDGDLDTAMNLMEEDAAEWKRRSKGKDVMREDEPYAGDEEAWSWGAFEEAKAKKDLDSWDERKMPGGFDAWNGA